MLVLTRKQQEKIHIGDGITITVLKMKGSAVRLGIEAPSEVSVVRGELKYRDNQKNQTQTSIEVEPLAQAATVSGKPRRAVMREANWASDSNAVLHRVPRSEADKLRGPLRAMIDQRVAVGG